MRRNSVLRREMRSSDKCDVPRRVPRMRRRCVPRRETEPIADETIEMRGRPNYVPARETEKIRLLVRQTEMRMR